MNKMRSLISTLKIGLTIFLLIAASCTVLALEVKGITVDLNYKMKAPPSCGEIKSWHGDFTDIDGIRRQNMHRGLDIVAPKGTEIVAPAPGKIIYKDKQYAGGNALMIYHGADRHGNHVISYFAHLQESKIDRDMKVKRGEVIATLGDTGNNMPRSRTAHLHFEILLYPDADFKYWFTGFLKGFTTVNPNYFSRSLEEKNIDYPKFRIDMQDQDSASEIFTGFSFPLKCS
jgi:murein DD-endopeptidase MepM/ murein hydrolase activator NlpD